MAEIVKLQVEKREKTGSAEARRMRRRGRVPGNVYGHGGGPVAISVAEEQLTPLVMGGQRVVDLQLDGDSQVAVLKELQWDPFGTHILHFDFLRVDRDERVEVEVPVQLRGIAPGITAGGILDHHLHTLALECPAFAVPDHFEVRIGKLQIGDAIHVRDLPLPEGMVAHNPPDDVVVQILQPREAPEEEVPAEAAGAEPEVIGRGEQKEEESEG